MFNNLSVVISSNNISSNFLSTLMKIKYALTIKMTFWLVFWSHYFDIFMGKHSNVIEIRDFSLKKSGK